MKQLFMPVERHAPPYDDAKNYKLADRNRDDYDASCLFCLLSPKQNIFWNEPSAYHKLWKDMLFTRDNFCFSWTYLKNRSPIGVLRWRNMYQSMCFIRNNVGKPVFSPRSCNSFRNPWQHPVFRRIGFSTFKTTPFLKHIAKKWTSVFRNKNFQNKSLEHLHR